jgi:hypothetical protein
VQVYVPGKHVPARQVSPVLQLLPTLQSVPSARGGPEQAPVAGLHVPAAWHAVAAHTTGLPVHAPAWQVSLSVQRFPSVQFVPLFAFGFEQMPVAGLQVPATWHWSSAVHVTGVPVHVPFWHVSLVWHRPLSHVAPFVLFGFEQTPVAGLHVPAT